MRDLPQGAVTFLFSDIEGSTELSRSHGMAYGDLRAEHRRVLREAVTGQGGREVDAEGDAFFAVFRRALDAVSAAVHVQRSLSEGEGVRVRIGVHTTEPHLHADGYIGVGVSRAARICAAGHGGQILLSHTTAGILEDNELEGVRLRDLGEHYLKGIRQPQRLFQIEAQGLPSDFPPLDADGATGTIATLLRIDLRGWRRVLREIGDDAAATAARRYQAIVAGIADTNGGRMIEAVGDNTMCVFLSPKSALVAAAEIRGMLADGLWIQGTAAPALSAAVHTGRVTGVSGKHDLGSSALKAWLLCEQASAGQVLVSSSTQALLEGELLDELSLRDLGERELPDSPPMRVYELVTWTTPGDGQ